MGIKHFPKRLTLKGLFPNRSQSIAIARWRGKRPPWILITFFIRSLSMMVPISSAFFITARVQISPSLSVLWLYQDGRSFPTYLLSKSCPAILFSLIVSCPLTFPVGMCPVQPCWWGFSRLLWIPAIRPCKGTWSLRQSGPSWASSRPGLTTLMGSIIRIQPNLLLVKVASMRPWQTGDLSLVWTSVTVAIDITTHTPFHCHIYLLKKGDSFSIFCLYSSCPLRILTETNRRLMLTTSSGSQTDCKKAYFSASYDLDIPPMNLALL